VTLLSCIPLRRVQADLVLEQISFLYLPSEISIVHGIFIIWTRIGVKAALIIFVRFEPGNRDVGNALDTRFDLVLVLRDVAEVFISVEAVI
jgi:hypothetical protein